MVDSFHEPVLLAEVCQALAPALHQESAQIPRIFVDATCGGAGHTEAIINAFHPDIVFALDRDPQAIDASQRRLASVSHSTQLHLVHRPFSQLKNVLEHAGIASVRAILADLGVSSFQLDRPERGFSFRYEGPLDMRMNPQEGEALAKLLAELSVQDLSRILRKYGEEPNATRIARAIIASNPQTTQELVQAVDSAIGAQRYQPGRRRIHPATRTFQALRIFINQELQQLASFLQFAPDLLEVGGRLAIISFHSLEDRYVKQEFGRRSRRLSPPAGVPIPDHALPPAIFAIPPGYQRGICPSLAEQHHNPRSRSSRLRVLQRVLP